MKIAELVHDARIALAKGDNKSAIELLKKAVEAEDALNYAEPAGWYIPARESLGGVLMLNGDYAEAEKVFRVDLDKNPRSGCSLFGLLKSLKAQRKNYDAQLVQKEFEFAWKNADIQLKQVEDLLRSYKKRDGVPCWLRDLETLIVFLYTGLEKGGLIF